MTPERYQRLKALFLEACEKPEADRAAFIADSTGHDQEMRRALEAQLSHDGVVDGPFDGPLGGSWARDVIERTLDEAMADESREIETDLPVSIGGYRIIRAIGDGGMGTVFEAEQDQPRRLVAVKVLRAGAMGVGSSQRLAREAELHGRLSHPCIAQVYEAGVADVRTASGRTGREAFVAMELVSGVALRDLTPSLTVKDRVELVARICEAVAHAHGRGVVHLDLKPANVLITRDESAPAGGFAWQPKILDFGIARALHADGTPATLMTSQRHIMGTLGYMSPERIDNRDDAVSPRADVYSLGAILFEVLTGRPAHGIPRASAPEALRARIERDPPSIASIDASLRGPLDAIAMTAMARDPAKRYASAGLMAADLRRFLDDRPVSARKPTPLETVTRILRRHKSEVWLSAAFVVLLIGAIITGVVAVLAVFAGASVACLWLAVRARRQQQRAERSEAVARAEQAKAAAIMTFLQDMLATADPAIVPGGRDMTVLDLLNHTARGLDDAGLASQPEVEVPVRTTVARAYLSLGRLDEAERQLRAAVAVGRIAFPQGHEDLAQVYNKLGRLLSDRGRHDEGIALFRESLAMYRALLGEEHERVATLLNNLGFAISEQGRLDEAQAMLEQALALRRRLDGPRDSSVASTLNNLALIHGRQGDVHRQTAMLRESLELDLAARRGEHPNIAGTMANLAVVLAQLDQLEESERLMREAQAMRLRVLGPTHPVTASGVCKLAWIVHRAGRFDEAESLFQEGVPLVQRTAGENHMFLLFARSEYGDMLISAGRPDAAANQLALARDTAIALFGSRHHFLVDILERLTRAQLAAGNVRDAEASANHALAVVAESMPESHWKSASARATAAECFARLGRRDEAETMLRAALDVSEAALGPSHSQVQRVREILAGIEAVVRIQA